MTAAERGAGAQETRLVALAGNPNVGKSTIFNALTGMHQHTGNWPGKTVALAQGTCRYKDAEIRLVDLPGTYALVSKSQEEALAAGFVSGGEADCVIAVCDATSLERSLILALQVLELTDRAFVCVNLMDEAQKQGIRLDLAALSFELGVPVVAVSAGREEGMQELLEQLRRILDGFEEPRPRRLGVIDASVRGTQAAVLALQGGSKQASDAIASRFVRRAEEIAGRVVCEENEKAKARAVRADRMLTGRFTGGLLLGALLGLVFWLTIQGANVPSALLQRGFDTVEGVLWAVADSFHAPSWLSGALIAGVYQTTAKVVSVMLPPVLIFFPLFTLLEDSGYLPRVAFLLDAGFERCGSCGKQALTMCMGFGCNAAGVSGCRIIDSEREKRIGMLTNALVPCNGRFPTLLTLSALFFGGTACSAALVLTGCVLFGAAMTMAASFVLGKTILRGAPSHFTLELPPFRMPNVGRVLVRSVMDRSLFVLGRAAAVAAPAGLLLWLLGNVQIGGETILTFVARALEPVGEWLGMDGAILLAFALSFPANELLLPVWVMIVSSGATLAQAQTADVGGLLLSSGWTMKTALCVMVFTLFHFPCSTTVLTIRKETGSTRWALLGMLLPAAIGVLFCRLLNLLL